MKKKSLESIKINKIKIAKKLAGEKNSFTFNTILEPFIGFPNIFFQHRSAFKNDIDNE